MIEMSRLKNKKTVFALCTVLLFLLGRVSQFIMCLEVKDYNSFAIADTYTTNRY